MDFNGFYFRKSYSETTSHMRHVGMFFRWTMPLAGAGAVPCGLLRAVRSARPRCRDTDCLERQAQAGVCSIEKGALRIGRRVLPQKEGEVMILWPGG